MESNFAHAEKGTDEQLNEVIASEYLVNIENSPINVEYVEEVCKDWFGIDLPEVFSPTILQAAFLCESDPFQEEKICLRSGGFPTPPASASVSGDDPGERIEDSKNFADFPPGGSLIAQNLPSQLIHDLIQIRHFIGCYHAVIGLLEIPTLQVLEGGLASTCPPAVSPQQECPVGLGEENEATASESKPTGRAQYESVASLHVRLLKVLLSDILPDAAAMEGVLLAGKSRRLSGETFANTSTIQSHGLDHITAAGSGLWGSSPFNNKRSIQTTLVGKEKSQSVDWELFACPVNDLTWPEVTRRLLVAAWGMREGLGRGRSLRDRGTFTRCLAGDGGVLLAVDSGVAAATANATVLAGVEKVMAHHVAALEMRNPVRMHEHAKDKSRKPKRSAVASQGGAPVEAAPVPVAVFSNGVIQPPTVLRGGGSGGMDTSNGTAGGGGAVPGGSGVERTGTGHVEVGGSEASSIRPTPAQAQVPSVPTATDSNAEMIAHLTTAGTASIAVGTASIAAGTASIAAAIEAAVAENEGGVEDGDWSRHLDPIRKLATNVGARIRNCIRAALTESPPPPPWAMEKLEWSISPGVYKGNASGPTKRAAIEVLEKHRGQAPSEVRKGKGGNAPRFEDQHKVLLPPVPASATPAPPPMNEPAAVAPCSPLVPSPQPPAPPVGPMLPVPAPPPKVSKSPFKPPKVPAALFKMHKLKPAPPPGLVMQRCRLILRQLAAADTTRAFCYFWGNGLPIPGAVSSAGDSAGLGSGNGGSSSGGDASGRAKGEKPGGWAPKPAVARPLDFHTIDLLLAVEAYGEAHEAFAADVRLIWSNVSKAYDRFHPVAAAATLLAPLFDRLYCQEVLQLFVYDNAPASEALALLPVPTPDQDPVPTQNATASTSEAGASSISDGTPLSGKSSPQPEENVKPVLDENSTALPDAPWSREGCRVCGVDQDDTWVLLCDACDSEYHMYCLRPPLERVPSGNWYCPQCALNGAQDRASKIARPRVPDGMDGLLQEAGPDGDGEGRASEGHSGQDSEDDMESDVSQAFGESEAQRIPMEGLGLKRSVQILAAAPLSKGADDAGLGRRTGAECEDSDVSFSGLQVARRHWLVERLGMTEYMLLPMSEKVALLKLLCQATMETAAVRACKDQAALGFAKVKRKVRSSFHRAKRPIARKQQVAKAPVASEPGSAAEQAREASTSEPMALDGMQYDHGLMPEVEAKAARTEGFDGAWEERRSSGFLKRKVELLLANEPLAIANSKKSRLENAANEMDRNGSSPELVVEPEEADVLASPQPFDFSTASGNHAKAADGSAGHDCGKAEEDTGKPLPAEDLSSSMPASAHGGEGDHPTLQPTVGMGAAEGAEQQQEEGTTKAYESDDGLASQTVVRKEVEGRRFLGLDLTGREYWGLVGKETAPCLLVHDRAAGGGQGGRGRGGGGRGYSAWIRDDSKAESTGDRWMSYEQGGLDQLLAWLKGRGRRQEKRLLYEASEWKNSFNSRNEGATTAQAAGTGLEAAESRSGLVGFATQTRALAFLEQRHGTRLGSSSKLRDVREEMTLQPAQSSTTGAEKGGPVSGPAVDTAIPRHALGPMTAPQVDGGAVAGGGEGQPGASGAALTLAPSGVAIGSSTPSGQLLKQPEANQGLQLFQVKRLWRCACLEPLWIDKWHCQVCHETFGGKKDYDYHRSGCAAFDCTHLQEGLRNRSNGVQEPPRNPVNAGLAPSDRSAGLTGMPSPAGLQGISHRESSSIGTKMHEACAKSTAAVKEGATAVECRGERAEAPAWLRALPLLAIPITNLDRVHQSCTFPDASCPSLLIHPESLHLAEVTFSLPCVSNSGSRKDRGAATELGRARTQVPGNVHAELAAQAPSGPPAESAAVEAGANGEEQAVQRGNDLDGHLMEGAIAMPEQSRVTSASVPSLGSEMHETKFEGDQGLIHAHESKPCPEVGRPLYAVDAMLASSSAAVRNGTHLKTAAGSVVEKDVAQAFEELPGGDLEPLGAGSDFGVDDGQLAEVTLNGEEPEQQLLSSPRETDVTSDSPASDLDFQMTPTDSLAPDDGFSVRSYLSTDNQWTADNFEGALRSVWLSEVEDAVPAASCDWALNEDAPFGFAADEESKQEETDLSLSCQLHRTVTEEKPTFHSRQRPEVEEQVRSQPQNLECGTSPLIQASDINDANLLGSPGVVTMNQTPLKVGDSHTGEGGVTEKQGQAGIFDQQAHLQQHSVERAVTAAAICRRPFMRQMQADLLDMEAAASTGEAMEVARGSFRRRSAWRAAVKYANTPSQLAQCCVLLEWMVRGDRLKLSWRFWTSVHAAVEAVTSAAVAFRIYALDEAILYERLGSAKPGKKGKSPGLAKKVKGSARDNQVATDASMVNLGPSQAKVLTVPTQGDDQVGNEGSTQQDQGSHDS